MKHGPVWISGGRYHGQIGYYDDDTDDKAIVYLGEPFKSRWVKIPHHQLESLDGIQSVDLEAYKRKHPDVLRALGLC